MSIAWGKRIISAVKQANKAAVIESGKLVFALIGVGTFLAQLSVSALWQFGAAVVVLGSVWVAVYSQMEGV